ncbi:MAG: hypothetical protein E7576_06760 [Ruminococcaceae bacterium]|jgi:hypothetical protein|nr:hypothetical protein [Oscillospiraceae bacterium]
MERQRIKPKDVPPRSDFPSLIFSEDGVLCGTYGIPTEQPELSDPGELRHLFLKNLGREREGFLRFCASRPDRPSFRLYSVTVGPYRAAFAEKAELLSTPVTAVFLAPSPTAFYLLMSPSSAYAADAVNRILFELSYLMNGGSPAFSSLSPEIYSVAERIPCLAEALFSRRCGVRCCDMEKILSVTAASLAPLPSFGSCRLRCETGRSSAERAGEVYGIERLAELPVEAFAAVLTALLLMAADLTADGEISLTLTDRGMIREVAVRVNTDCLSDGCREEEGADGLFLLPEAFHSRVRFLSALCVLTHMDLCVSTSDTEEIPTRNGRQVRALSVSLLIGAEPPPLLDFKYSEPERAVPAIVRETAALLAASVPAPGEKDHA